jgi:hypothetical protein
LNVFHYCSLVSSARRAGTGSHWGCAPSASSAPARLALSAVQGAARRSTSSSRWSFGLPPRVSSSFPLFLIIISYFAQLWRWICPALEVSREHHSHL